MMFPPPGERIVRHVGDRLRFALRVENAAKGPVKKAFLRTNLGRAATLRREIIAKPDALRPLAGESWRDVPLRHDHDEWTVELALADVGFFQAKAYCVDAHGRQFWPDGENIGISVHPNHCRTANTIYCAFTRMFGASRTAAATMDPERERRLNEWDHQGYTVIPPSGKFRDLAKLLPHIFETLGCRILHLLPVNPTPTTSARFGRFGSPYACGDLTAIDPALAQFDRRTTAVEQFQELTEAVRLRGGQVFLDLVINHTGWGSTLQENHPQWFKRAPNGEFASPGAWGNTWADLVELEPHHRELWDHLAEAFLIWCRRGVGGFRCDAGYKVPPPVWQYIAARVRTEFPDTVFFLEGLGGGWDDTANLLTHGGMQWAYSELFQELGGAQVAGYLDHALKQSLRVGTLVHYSETHDNDRLAARGRAWSLLRNRLSALTSVNGAFGFTGGVEWLATEKINVHSSRGMNWGSPDNLLPELTRLNHLLGEHPCFFDGAKITRISPSEAPILALLRESAKDQNHVLVLVNLDPAASHSISVPLADLSGQLALAEKSLVDLLGQTPPEAHRPNASTLEFKLEAGAAFCLSDTSEPRGLCGEKYRAARAQGAWATAVLAHSFSPEEIGPADWRELAAFAAADPFRLLALQPQIDRAHAGKDLLAALAAAAAVSAFPQVVLWTPADRTRVLLVPPACWLLFRDEAPFLATLTFPDATTPCHIQSVPVPGGYIASFPPRNSGADAALCFTRLTPENPHVQARLRFLSTSPAFTPPTPLEIKTATPLDAPRILLVNGRGGMARLCIDLGSTTSKYDCLLGANLHAELPVDRHILAKRARVWATADGFIAPLNAANLIAFRHGPPARWEFVVSAGDGRAVEIHMEAAMCESQNSTQLRFHRPAGPPRLGTDLPSDRLVSLTVRVDIEDRNFHCETERNGGTERHFSTCTTALNNHAGFRFEPESDRVLAVFSDHGRYHPDAEWCDRLAHPVEESRGQPAAGTAYSPGWFEMPLDRGETATLTLTAEPQEGKGGSSVAAPISAPPTDSFGQQLAQAAHAFVVQRGTGQTVIAGYPWFLDWGRDTLICARGLLVAGMELEVRRILTTFARFEQKGTLPNSINGENASNRDTSDAPLWFGVLCEEAAAKIGQEIYSERIDQDGRTVADVLGSIAAGYLHGTSNGIRVDAESGLVWSPSHFTWMDTNYPAGTPREGYPIEIQVLWIRLLRQLARIQSPPLEEPWNDMGERAEASLRNFFWIEEKGWMADLLQAPRGVPARFGKADDALRPNMLFAVSLGLMTGARARSCVAAAQRHLLVPGALRSLAPLPVSLPLIIHAADGRSLNDPSHPYWGRYEGDEDTRRKPAYHNGTAWTWLLPIFCEALVRAWEASPASVCAARAYLGSAGRLLAEGCIGQIPEILDGDAPHQQRGCDAQAWGATEALRVWHLLSVPEKLRCL
jgi:predicted glycogen debranching enzyme